LHYKEIKKILSFGGQKLLFGVKIDKIPDPNSSLVEIVWLMFSS